MENTAQKTKGTIRIVAQVAFPDTTKKIVIIQPELSTIGIGTFVALGENLFALALLTAKEDGKKGLLFSQENREAQDCGFVVIKPFQTGWQTAETVFISDDERPSEKPLVIPVIEKHFKDVNHCGVFLYEGNLWKKTAPSPHKGKEGWAFSITGEDHPFDKFEDKETVWQIDPSCCTVKEQKR